MPKGARPKTIKNPIRDSPNKLRTDIRSDPVEIHKGNGETKGRNS